MRKRDYVFGLISFIVILVGYALVFDHRTDNKLNSFLQSLTPIPTPLQTTTPLPPIDQRISNIEEELLSVSEEVKKPGKDIYDKIESVTGLITGGVVVLFGIYVTFLYRKKEIAISETQTIEKFLPHLLSDDEKNKEAALVLISELGNFGLSARLANIFKSEGAISALDRLSSVMDIDIAQKAQASLYSLAGEEKEKIAVLVSSFDNQLVPGDLFGIRTDFRLPAIETTYNEWQENEKRYDIKAEGSDETWLVTVKLTLSNLSSAHEIVKTMKTVVSESLTKYWVVVMGQIPEAIIRYLAHEGFLVSLEPNIEELEALIYTSNSEDFGGEDLY